MIFGLAGYLDEKNDNNSSSVGTRGDVNPLAELGEEMIKLTKSF